MSEDEAGTLARSKSLREVLVQPKIAEGRGRKANRRVGWLLLGEAAVLAGIFVTSREAEG